MVKLEETCRDLKSKIKDKSTINNTIDSVQLDTSNMVMSEEKVEELQRANKILMRSKEVQFKKG